MDQNGKKGVPLTADRLSVFCYQLSLMQRAGISAEEGVSTMLGDAGAEWEKHLLSAVLDRLSAGEPLDRALSAAGVFPDYLLRMVEIGQASGRLDRVLSALSGYYRREAAIQGAIRRTVAYPAMMTALITFVFLVLLAKVLPVFQGVFAQLGMSLPPVAAALMKLGSAGGTIAVVLAVLVLAGALALFALFRTRKGTEAARRLGQKLLKNSAVTRAVDRSRFASAMALMLSSGLPLDEAVERTARLLEGTGLEPLLRLCRAEMERGALFPTAVERAGILDGLPAGLLAAGFRAGVPEQAMEELADRCREEADERLGRLLGRVEYALVLALCLSVGVVLLSVMLPLLGAMSAIGA